MSAVDLAVLGNLLIDDLVFDDGRTLMGEPGGATLYLSLAALLWGVRVAVVSVAGSDYPQDALAALAARGADLSGVRRVASPSLRTWLLYEGRRRRVVHRLGGPTHEEASPTAADLAAAPAARAVHLAPMPFEIQRALLGALPAPRPALVSLDPHRPIDERTLPSWREALAGIDALFVGEDELALDGDPDAALDRLAVGRLGLVVAKRGAAGGTLREADGSRRRWSALDVPVVDPTGAGDAFAGGLLAAQVLGRDRAAGIEQALVSASFAIEDRGIAGLLRATPAAAEQRRRERFGEGSR